jgi:hypothetical protein
MSNFLLRRVLPLIICLSLGPLVAFSQTQDNNSLLTNASVVKLVKAGFKEKSIITIISSRPAHFELSTERLIELKRSGVSEKIILAMMARQEGNDFSDEAWSDDEFFNAPLNPSMGSTKDNARAGSPSDGSSVDIFGSSGGSRGTTKTRSGSGSSSGDTITTGSATVRILRPPTEAGGAGPTKLEKTKSLNNDAVIELVEAGFSEGTIIRRIEQSPVDFDLAPEKLADLKKHRVSEKIVTAMKTAMGVDSGASSTPTANATPKQ